jgi:hypothetical protein
MTIKNMNEELNKGFAKWARSGNNLQAIMTRASFVVAQVAGSLGILCIQLDNIPQDTEISADAVKALLEFRAFAKNL